MRSFLLPGLAAALCACATAKPVLYPNPHYQEAGKEQAQADAKDCGKRASEFVKNDRATRTAAHAVEGGAVGAAAGAASGAVFGSLGRGSLAGGIGGAAAGLVGGIFRTRQPNPAYKGFVDRCMRERGYEVVGWQ